jgi:hypothetical protein
MQICTPMGHRGFPGPALSFIRMSNEKFFVDRLYNNEDLTYVTNNQKNSEYLIPVYYVTFSKKCLT